MERVRVYNSYKVTACSYTWYECVCDQTWTYLRQKQPGHSSIYTCTFSAGLVISIYLLINKYNTYSRIGHKNETFYCLIKRTLGLINRWWQLGNYVTRKYPLNGCPTPTPTPHPTHLTVPHYIYPRYSLAEYQHLIERVFIYISSASYL